MKVNEEKQRELLAKVKYEDKAIKWKDTIDGMGLPMLTTTYKGKTYDVCINYDNGIAIVYKFNKYGMGECKNMPYDMVIKYIKGKITVINPIELHMQTKM
ncbi:hypothetical protein [Clostridium sp. UBA5988]|jgi:hypothetical protein|uniref:hypothetical protein n=1 Tax=Clostridium sp. UBA5988 TaxID=1946369 RepID=UPI003217097B